MEDRWLSVDEIAEYIGIKRDTAKGLYTLKSIAYNLQSWVVGGHRQRLRHQKAEEKTNITTNSEPDDAGHVRLRINQQNAGSTPPHLSRRRLAGQRDERPDQKPNL
ncbi:MAG: hypothetical protein JRE64_00955 [Deltaproteobacteria bacterium]|nr:hypothetical protein [Deltaproteobacteria bacterium]